MSNFVGADRLLDELGDGATVVTVFADSNKKYLSTDLYRAEPVVEGYASPGMRMVSWRAIGCEACCASLGGPSSQAVSVRNCCGGCGG